MIIYEKERSNKEFYVYHQDDVNLTFPLHIHNSIEFVACIEGELLINIENEQFALHENDCAIILPNYAHEYLTPTYSKSYLCVISTDHVPFFCNVINNKKPKSTVFQLKNLNDIINNLKKPKNLFFLKSTVYYILASFYESTEFTSVKSENESFLHICVEYINENYMYDITLHDLAEKLGYTYNYCSMLFNETIHDSFSDFLNECRISYAANLLLETDKSISDIAISCGYNSLRVFNRNFLKFKNITPSKFRSTKKQINNK